MLLLLVLSAPWGAESYAQPRRVVDLTLDSAVDLAMENSYRVRQLRLGIDETRSWLRAEQAGLKSRVYMEVTTPQFQRLSDYKWNSDLRRDEIIRENTRLWQMDFSVRQPVVLLGYPTNGYLSLNNRVYRYTQLTDQRDVKFYNRYFIRYEQPLFQPNALKYDIEEAELNLQRAELAFQEDVVDMMDDIADDYFDIFELTYEVTIYRELVANLEQAATAARNLAMRDSTRSLDVGQVQVELANARERVKQTQSSIRLSSSELRRRLRLTEHDSLRVNAVLEVKPVQVDVAQAIRYGQMLRPALKRLSLQERQNEISLAATRGQGGFRANLELTYGRESLNPYFTQLWEQPTNSYSVGLRAYVPIWDWGQRRARIQAQRINLQQTALSIEEAEENLRAQISNAVLNLNEYQQRALTMQDNLDVARQITRQTMERYGQGAISILELLQSFTRERDTAENFLDAYLGYRRALLSLQTNTFYDFDSDMPLLERLQVQASMNR